MKYKRKDLSDYNENPTRNTGARVRALMKSSNESVASLACVINVSPSQMSKLLDDKCEWTLDKVLSVSEHFGVPFQYICYGMDIYSDVSEANFVAHFRGTLMHLDKLPEEEMLICYMEMGNKLLEKLSKCMGKAE